MTNYYVYYYSQAVYTHDCTCPTKEAAEDRVAELQATGKYEQVLYTIGFVIKGAFY